MKAKTTYSSVHVQMYVTSPLNIACVLNIVSFSTGNVKMNKRATIMYNSMCFTFPAYIHVVTSYSGLPRGDTTGSIGHKLNCVCERLIVTWVNIFNLWPFDPVTPLPRHAHDSSSPHTQVTKNPSVWYPTMFSTQLSTRLNPHNVNLTFLSIVAKLVPLWVRQHRICQDESMRSREGNKGGTSFTSSFVDHHCLSWPLPAKYQPTEWQVQVHTQQTGSLATGV